MSGVDVPVRTPGDGARAECDPLAAIHRVARALVAAVSFDDLGVVVAGSFATEAGASVAVLALRGSFFALHGVLAPDDVEGQSRSLDALRQSWDQPSTGWIAAARAAILPLVVGGERRGTLVLGWPAETAPDLALCEALTDLLALACGRAAFYEETVVQRARAEAAVEEQDRVLGHLAHELRNPLSPIIAATQLMQLRAPEASVKERATIERSAARLVKLVDDLLDAMRLARGKLEISPTPIALGEIVERALVIATPLLEERGHQVAATIPPSLVVAADRERLAQAVAQILINAAKYTQRDGTIAVVAACEGDQIQLRVTDTGVGIPSELIGTIFERFVQGKYGSRGGLGVGLAIARGIVELHGGTIGAASSGTGEGSTFTIVMPRCPERDTGDDPGSLIAACPRRILVVDDNEDAAWLLAEALRMLGHDVRLSHDGAQALELARQWAPEIAFLDIGLPGLDGFALCEQLSRLPSKPRCVAVTGYGAQRDRDRSRAAGFARHFVKPIDLRDVTDVIASFH